MVMQAVVEDLMTHYQVSGLSAAKKPRTLLLLHGWGDNLSTFKDLQSELSKDYRVFSLDLPGFGQTQMPPAVWGLREYAQFTKDFMGKMKIHPYAIIGHSNGAALAIDGVAHGQLAPQKLILMGAAGIRDQQKARRLAIKVIAKSGKYATIWLPQRRRQSLRKRLYGVAGSDALVVPQLQETFRKTVKQDVQAEATQLEVPTLLIYGEQDKATPPLYGEIYHNQIKNSTLEILGQAGHFVHHDQPEKVTGLIKDFLK